MTATPGPHVAAGAVDAEQAVVAVAAREPLLVALDFDGVCAPLVDDPADSRMLPGTREALRALAGTGCHVALVSGRGLASLREVSEPDPGWLLVGGHGAEPGSGEGVTLDAAEADRLARVEQALADVVADHPGTSVEHKPTAAVLHVRRAGRDVAAAATRAALDGPGRLPGVQVKQGHDVVELAVRHADKGGAVTLLRAQTGAASVLYVGDDVTDEDAFAVLDPLAGDVGVKVGDGDTAAAHRVATPQDVTGLLEALLRTRAGARPRA